MSYIKRFIAILPESAQEEMKRIYFKYQIRNQKFGTPEPEYLELDKYVRDGDWVIDVGANVGHYTMKLSNLVGANGRVIAFEPVSTTFCHLTNNAQLATHKNITLINAAVSESSKLVGMSIPRFATGLSNYYQASIDSGDDDSDTFVLTISVDSLRLSNTIRFIKVDAEGHEPAVLRGLRNVINRDKPILVLETVTDEIRGDLIKVGYVESRLEGSPNTIFKAMN